MTTISKTTFTFTVVHRTDQPFNELAEAIDRSFDGHAVGWETGCTTVSVPAAKVADELGTLGNDGTFFDQDLADESTEVRASELEENDLLWDDLDVPQVIKTIQPHGDSLLLTFTEGGGETTLDRDTVVHRVKGDA